MSERLRLKLALFDEEALFPQWQEASEAQDWDYITWLEYMGLDETADIVFMSAWQGIK